MSEAQVRIPASKFELVRLDDGERLVRWWEPAGEPVASLVIVHGYAEHSGRYERVGGQLAAAGIASWAIDLRGHGRSTGERALVEALDHLLDDARRVFERARAARPDLPALLLGHSMGGLVATAFTLRFPKEVAGLVLSGPAVGDPSALEALLDLEPLPEVILSPELLARDPRVGEDYDRDPLNYRGPFRRETLRSLVAGAREVRARFAELELPLLLLHGGDDALVEPSASRDLHAGAASPDKELAIYPGLRHEVLNEPEGVEITARIARWVRERAARAAPRR